MSSNTNNPLLSISGSGNVAGSFVDSSFSVDDGIVKEIVEKFGSGDIVSQIQLKTRFLTVLIENRDKVKVYLGKMDFESKSQSNETFTHKFHLFLVQTDKKIYLLVVSDFDIYKHLNQEPFILQDALEDFHEGLKKCLGLKYGKAYFGSTTEKMSEIERKNTGIVAVIESNFNQLVQDNQSYILFSL